MDNIVYLSIRNKIFLYCLMYDNILSKPLSERNERVKLSDYWSVCSRVNGGAEWYYMRRASVVIFCGEE